jgi:hypothetical protein
MRLRLRSALSHAISSYDGFPSNEAYGAFACIVVLIHFDEFGAHAKMLCVYV